MRIDPIGPKKSQEFHTMPGKPEFSCAILAAVDSGVNSESGFTKSILSRLYPLYIKGFGFRELH
ncbi:MAG: hypothetical protein OHK0035_24790 [Cyanobacteria bacterium J069]